MKKISRLFLTLSCLFASYIAVDPSEAIIAQAAASEEEKIEVSNPFEDLSEDEQFTEDYANGVYKFDTNKEIQFLKFFEYKYQNTYTSDFGLYIYFYNPNKGNLPELLTTKHKIQISTNGTDYYKYNLKFISRSIGEIEDMFYKYKVVIDKTFYDQLNSETRDYHISSFEIKLAQDSQVKDIEVGKTYKFSGYAKGCNDNEESTLSCIEQGLETVNLKVYGGYKRSSYINTGLTKAIDLHYVYFEIPNRYIRSYGEPYAVSYEYYDCYTDKGVWNIDKDKSTYYPEKKWWQYGDNSMGTQCYAEDPFTWDNSADHAELDNLWALNTISGDLIASIALAANGQYAKSDNTVGEVCKNNKYANYKFDLRSKYSPTWISKNKNAHSNINSNYKYKDNSWRYTPGALLEALFRGKNWNSKISKKDIAGRIDKYGMETFSSKKNQKYSGVLTSTIDDLTSAVTPSVEEPNYETIVGLLMNLITHGNGQWGRTQEDSVTWDQVPVYQRVTNAEDSEGTRYAIDKDDVSHFNKVLSGTTTKDTTMCILHFAETEYYSSPIFFRRDSAMPFSIGGRRYTKIGYSSFMHIIDQFDILSLTFRINDQITIIPVVSDPIRIVPNATAPVDDRPEGESWWESLTQSLNIKRLIGIIAGVVLVFVAIIVIKKIIGAVSTKRAMKANKITIREAKKKRKDKNRHEG